MLIKVTAPYFVGGLIFNQGEICTDAAPIIKYCKGKSLQWCLDYFNKKGWETETLL